MLAHILEDMVPSAHHFCLGCQIASVPRLMCINLITVLLSCSKGGAFKGSSVLLAALGQDLRSEAPVDRSNLDGVGERIPVCERVQPPVSIHFKFQFSCF